MLRHAQHNPLSPASFQGRSPLIIVRVEVDLLNGVKLILSTAWRRQQTAAFTVLPSRIIPLPIMLSWRRAYGRWLPSNVGPQTEQSSPDILVIVVVLHRARGARKPWEWRCTASWEQRPRCGHTCRRWRRPTIHPIRTVPISRFIEFCGSVPRNAHFSPLKVSRFSISLQCC